MRMQTKTQLSVWDEIVCVDVAVGEARADTGTRDFTCV